MATKIGFIGLGTMGAPMAWHLATKSSDVSLSAYNRTPERASAWRQRFADHETSRYELVSTPYAVAAGKDVVMLCVSTDSDLESLCLEGKDSLLSVMAAGSVLVDHSTVSAKLAQKLWRLFRDKGVGFLDAPVSGGQDGAEKGRLSIMCGGESSDFERVKPFFKTYGDKIGLVGSVGSGQMAKMMNQICIAGMVQGLSEALHLGVRSGLDIDKILTVIAGGAAGSWAMDNRARNMVKGKFDYGFAIDLMRKDLRLCLAHANQNNLSLPITDIIARYYDELSEKGHGNLDSSALFLRLAD